jgi:hypothetical protein
MSQAQALAKTKTARQRLRVDDTTKAVMARLGAIAWDAITPIPPKATGRPTTAFESTITTIEKLASEPYCLEIGRIFAVNAVARSSWNRWCRFAEQGLEPYYSRLKQFESVALGMVCHFAQKVSQADGPMGARLAANALGRMFNDS